MKTILAILFCSLLSVVSKAGDTYVLHTHKPGFSKDTTKYRNFYLGIGTGMNNHAGILGIITELGIKNTGTVFAAVGLSTWGYKVSGGAKYYFTYPKRSALGIGYSLCSGSLGKEVTVKLESTDVATQTTAENDVVLVMNYATTINLSYSYYWIIGKHHRFNIEAGYAIPFGAKAYTVKSAHELSSASESAMRLIQPGGLIIAAAFTFGIR